MTELERQIQDAAQRYYSDGSSPLTDEEFDALVDKLKLKQPDSSLFVTGWGYVPNSSGGKHKHRYGKAGSLTKCRTYSELNTQLKGQHVDLSLKLDGISCVLYYKDGVLIQALTRGDGEIGIDITQKIRKIISFSTLHIPFTGAIRGEILMSYENFKQFQKIHPDAKNPRNSTAGIINGKDTDVDLKFLNLVVYTVVGASESLLPETSIADVRRFLSTAAGADNVVPYQSDVLLDESTFLTTMQQFRDKWYGVYPADGIVLTYDHVRYNRCSEGYSVVYAAQAFKFAAEQKTSEVICVEWTMTKTRYAMPKIRVEPVTLSGTTVQYCTGYNAKYILDNKIGPGTILIIQKRGEIIPNVDEVVHHTEAAMITCCPECRHELIWQGVHLMCPNVKCPNAVRQDTLIWMECIAPTDGLGDTLKLSVLNTLIEAKELSDFSIESIMTSELKLSDNTESAQKNLFATMWRSLHSCTVSMQKALLALNIPRLGDVTSKKLASDVETVWMLNQSALAGETKLQLPLLMKLYTVVGQADAQAIEANLWKFSRLQYLRDRIRSSQLEFRGQVAITGKLSVRRADFEKELRSSGYSVGELSKSTLCLITDDPNSSSSKNLKANKLHIPKLSEAEFRAQYLR